ncbi:polysaccharide export protein [Rhizobium sp. CRIBSB]|nr:polysaccharide export protein [Rhizobium sp. CRIBSB]
MMRFVLALTLSACLGACSTLPSDGPSARAAADVTAAGYQMVVLDAGLVERLNLAEAASISSLSAADHGAPLDVIGIGDTLSVSIHEPSGALFGAGATGRVQGASQTLAPSVVDRDGAISVPFAGQVPVAGLTPSQAAEATRRALGGRVANPQVAVVIAANPSSSVTVLGEVRNPGRTTLNVNSHRVLDVIGAAGGSPRPVEDVEVVIRRGDQTFSAPLSAVTTRFGENVRLARGDQINLTYRPRRYSTFGAVGAAAQTDMGAGPLTLAGALARAGGLDDQSADARSVLVFRFETPATARALGLEQPATIRGVPVIYRLDLADPAGFFLAGRFLIQPEDVIYAPRARSAEARKFFEFVQSLTRVVYDVSVTSTLSGG